MNTSFLYTAIALASLWLVGSIYLCYLELKKIRGILSKYKFDNKSDSPHDK